MGQTSEIRYLYDQNEIRTDVVIPISAWSEYIAQIIMGKITNKEKFDPADYIGIVHYTGSSEDLDKEIKQLRNEWERLWDILSIQISSFILLPVLHPMRCLWLLRKYWYPHFLPQ